MKIESNLIHIPIWLFNGLCLFLLLSKVHLFSPDNSLIIVNDELSPIGRFESIKGLVKRSHAQSLSWFLANESDSAFKGETVFTAANSSARLKIEDNIIELKENSVIKLNKIAADEYSISLIRGEVKGKIKDKFKVVFKDKKGAEKEVVLPVSEDKPLAFELDEVKEVKTEPLKPLFFDSFDSNDTFLASELEAQNTIEFSWSGEKDKDVIFKVFDEDGELIKSFDVEGKNKQKVSLPTVNTRYIASIQYKGEKELSTSSFWLLSSKNISIPRFIYPEEEKIFGDEETQLRINLEDYKFYQKYGEVELDIYHDGVFKTSIDIFESEIKDGEFILELGKLGVFGEFSFHFKGRVEDLNQNFESSKKKFFFLPISLSNKLRLENEVIEHEIGLEDEN